MSHMPTFLQPQIGSGNRFLGMFVYVATGVEGEDFSVVHNGNYALPYLVIWAPQGMAAIPSIDLPSGGSNRTVNSIRVLTNGPLTAGDQILFLFFAV